MRRVAATVLRGLLRMLLVSSVTFALTAAATMLAELWEVQGLGLPAFLAALPVSFILFEFLLGDPYEEEEFRR